MPNATFYPGKAPSGVLASYRDTEHALERGWDVETTQMSFLGHPRICDYDRVVIAEVGHVVRIDNNHDGTWSCASTDRELTHGHDLFRLWKGGEFDGEGGWLRVPGPRHDGTICPADGPMTVERFMETATFSKLDPFRGDGGVRLRKGYREYEARFCARTRVAVRLCDTHNVDYMAGVEREAKAELLRHLRGEFA